MSTPIKKKIVSSATAQDELNKRSKKEWIEIAEVFKRERFEIAGALFDCKEDELLTQYEVQKRLEAYFDGPKKEVTYVDSKE